MCDVTRWYVSHGTFICVTWLADMWDMIYSMCDVKRWYVRHDSFICVTWLVDMWVITHSYVWRDSLICGTWFICICYVKRWYVRHDSFICVTWLVYLYAASAHRGQRIESPNWAFICVTWLVDMWDRTHSYLWRGSLICETGHIHICDVTRWYVRHDSSICVTWLVDMWVMTDSHVWRHSLICETGHIHMCDVTRWYMRNDSFIRVKRLVDIWDMTHSYVWHDSYISMRHLCVRDSMLKRELKEASHNVKETRDHQKRPIIMRKRSMKMTWLLHMCDMTLACVCDTCASVTRYWHVDSLNWHSMLPHVDSLFTHC